MSTSGSAFVNFIDVQKSYDGETLVVKDLNLAIRRGEFLTLLGPSGSGKTTTLMMLAGFEVPTHGRIELDGQQINDLAPHKRDIGMVFQNYALFPHMTVEENLAFPLAVRRLPKAEIDKKIERALAMVQLTQMRKRRPAQLSGGQQQRVALARALVFDPKLVLMDEPLGALDKQLREHMQLEIKHIHQSLGVTVVYVTHDQGEALTMSDRVAVFNDGAIQQLASPADLYEKPQNSFVAQFIGENNRLSGVVTELNGQRLPGEDRRGGRDPRPARQHQQCRRQDHLVAAAGAGAHQSHQRRLRQPVRRDGGGADLSRRPHPRAGAAAAATTTSSSRCRIRKACPTWRRARPSASAGARRIAARSTRSEINHLRFHRPGTVGGWTPAMAHQSG